MRKILKWGTKLVLTVIMAGCIFTMPYSKLTVHALEGSANVQGTILKGTTSELILLSTKEGKMEIKLDSQTDTSGAKILLPDTKVTITVVQGSDAYLHATKITSDQAVVGFELDTSTKATVTGTIGSKTKGDLLYVNTKQGEMQIKLDTSTDMSGCNVLVAGKEYAITCARGTDAFMHAISISDKSTSTTTTGTESVTAPGNVKTMSVTGTVAKKTKSDLLYLSTKDGEMQFKIDSSADTGKGMVLTLNRKMTVTFYHGSDAYLHALVITGEKEDAKDISIDTSKLVSVSGTVDSKSTENLLYLNTSDGTMELKLDAVKTLNNCKALIGGQKISVNCAYGSDAYMHAIDISAK